jgi:hypothetical protein
VPPISLRRLNIGARHDIRGQVGNLPPVTIDCTLGPQEFQWSAYGICRLVPEDLACSRVEREHEMGGPIDRNEGLACEFTEVSSSGSGIDRFPVSTRILHLHLIGAKKG